MSKMRTLAAAAVLTIVAATTAEARNACIVPDNANVWVQQMADTSNAERARHGLRPLAYNQTLARAAQGHACDMVQRGFFGHTGSGGSNVQRRVRNAGYRDCLVAENIAMGNFFQNGQMVTQGWMDSPGHRRNMLLARAEEFGLAMAMLDGNPYFVMVLAKGCSR